MTLPPHQIMWPRKQVLIVSLSLPGDVTLEKFPNIACSHFPFSTAEIITVHGCWRTSFIHICFWYLRLSKSSQEEDQQRTSSYSLSVRNSNLFEIEKENIILILRVVAPWFLLLLILKSPQPPPCDCLDEMLTISQRSKLVSSLPWQEWQCKQK